MLTLLTLVFTLFLQPLGHEQEHDIPLLFVTECSTDTVSVLISWELCAYHCLLHRGLRTAERQIQGTVRYCVCLAE